MSNSYYDLTGVLRLKQVTPIIKALFGGLSLDPDYPGNGEAYFARMSVKSLESPTQPWVGSRCLPGWLGTGAWAVALSGFGPP